MTGTGRVVRRRPSPGQAGDLLYAPTLLEGLAPGHVLADANYDSDAFRQRIGQAGAVACVRPNGMRKRGGAYDRERYKHRNVIERFFGKLKARYRRVATRYEKKPANYLGFARLAATLTSVINVHTT